MVKRAIIGVAAKSWRQLMDVQIDMLWLQRLRQFDRNGTKIVLALGATLGWGCYWL